MKLINQLALIFCLGIGSASAAIPEGWSVTPKPDSTVESITTIQVSTDDEITSVSYNGLTINGKSYSYSYKNMGYDVIFTLDNPIYETGTYNCVISAGTIKVDGYDVVDEEVSFTLKVMPGGGVDNSPVIPTGYSVSPAPGSSVGSIRTIQVTAPDQINTVKVSSVTVDSESVPATGSKLSNTVVEITLTTPITAAGSYRIGIPSGCFTVFDGDFSYDGNEALAFTLNVTGDSSSETPEPEQPAKPSGTVIPNGFTVTPENNATVSELSTITVFDDIYGGLGVNNGAALYINDETVSYTANVSGEDADLLTITLTSPITANGTYEIYLPEGFFSRETEQSKAFLWNVTVNSSSSTPETPGDNNGDYGIPSGYSIYPGDGSKVSSLTTFTVTSTTGQELNILADEIYVNGRAQEVEATWENGSPTNLQITLIEPITDAGSYKVVIPEGAILVGSNYADAPAFSFSYIVDPSLASDTESVPAGFSVSPSPGSEVSEIAEITVSTPGYDCMLLGSTIQIDGKNVSVTSASSNDYSIVLVLASPVKEAGQHTITIPQGTISYEDVESSVNPAITFTLTVNPTLSGDDDNNGDDEGEDSGVPAGFSVSPAPYSIVEELTQITVSSTRWMDIVAKGNYILVNGKQVAVTSEVIGEFGMKVIFTLAETITEAGDYEITIPAGMFTYDDLLYSSEEFNFIITVKYSTTAIENINVEDGAVEIYTIQGLRVNEMTPGNLYIVRKNGKTSKVFHK